MTKLTCLTLFISLLPNCFINKVMLTVNARGMFNYAQMTHHETQHTEVVDDSEGAPQPLPTPVAQSCEVIAARL